MSPNTISGNVPKLVVTINYTIWLVCCTVLFICNKYICAMCIMAGLFIGLEDTSSMESGAAAEKIIKVHHCSNFYHEIGKVINTRSIDLRDA